MKRLSVAFLLIGILVVLFRSVAAQTAVSQPSPAAEQTAPTDDTWREKTAEKLDDALLTQLRNQPANEPLTAIVKLTAQADLSAASHLRSRTARRTFVYNQLRQFAQQQQPAILADVERLGRQRGEAVSVQPYFIFNGFAITATPELIWELARRQDVATIMADQQLELHQSEPLPSFGQQMAVQNVPTAPGWNIEQIRADEVWAAYGLTGEGVVVGSIDTGVHYTHPALMAQYAGNVGNGSFDHDFHWFDPISAVTQPYDDNGHGTHTTGTAVGGDGLGAFADDIGVAPGAKWIAVKAFDGAGFAATSVIHLAFEWMLAPCPVGIAPGSDSCDPSRAPDVLNNSWGSSNGTSLIYADDVAALRAAGIWPVFSAGNSGPNPATLGAPGSFATAFSVGAVNRNDVIADFSSRGPSRLTDDIKPDVTAPGVAVVSAVPGGGYQEASGTSMAAPHVTGLGALLLSAEPTLDLETMERLVRTTTVDLGEAGPDYDYGYGRVDALTVVGRLLDAANLQGTVREAGTGTPLAGVAVRLVGQGLTETAVSDANGHYSFSFLIAGDYDLSIDHYGYAPQTVVVNLAAQANATQDIDLVALPRFVISGFVTDAITPTIPISNALVTALETPLASVTTDANGFYEIEVAQGEVLLEAAAFGYATAVSPLNVTAVTTANFSLTPLPPVLLVDDDEGRTKTYSPHVEDYYFTMLDAGGYNYDYWDIEIDGSPDFDTIRQYPAVVWFGGEFGRIKDISDQPQAEAVMAYLDIGGNFFYIAQEHTFYFNLDSECDTPRWGGTGPCRFSEQYLGIADWVEDQKADEAVGAAGNPVGDGLGPYPLTYPPLVADFTDTITGTEIADLAFIGLDDLPEGQMNLASYTVVSPTADFKTVFMAMPLEAFPASAAADVMQRVMDWFGVNGLTDGPSFVPGRQTGRAIPGETITFNVRIKNFSDVADSYSLTLLNDAWPTTIWNGEQTAVLSEIGPIDPQETADLVVTVDVPLAVVAGAELPITLRAQSQSGSLTVGEATLLAQAEMTYYWRDSDLCNGGIHFEWVDAAALGDRWDVDADHPAQQVTLPEPFLFYNESYDKLWLNLYATILFGEENLLDDLLPSGEPPIPNPTLLDPNRAIYAAWGNLYWFPEATDPTSAIYTYHDTTNGRNWFVIEYHLYENFLGGPDTFEIILDLDSNEIRLQYLVITDSRQVAVGIENGIGSDGILYVHDNLPAQNQLHDNLALHFGVGEPPTVWEAELTAANDFGTGVPNGFADYKLTIHNNSTLPDDYTFEVANSDWPVTFWDSNFEQQIEAIGSLPPCGTAEFGVRVALPADTDYVQNEAIVRVRSLGNTLVAPTAVLTTDNAAPAFSAPADRFGAAVSGETAVINVPIQNTGNITDTYLLSVAEGAWAATVTPTQTVTLPPGAATTAVISIDVPATAPASATDLALLSISSASYPGTDGAVNIHAEATPNVAVAWDEAAQTKEGPEDWTIRYVVTVRNKGNLLDRFAVSALGAEWTTTFWNDSFTSPLTQTAVLGPDETARIGVQVRIPAGATPPMQDALLVVATSQLDPTKQAHTLLTTAVSPPPPATYGVAFTPVAAWQTGVAGETLSYLLELHNLGTATDSYSLSAAGNRWPTTVEPLTVSGVPPQAKVFVTVTVTVAETADFDEVAILAQSLAETAVVAQANLISVRKTAVGSHRLYLPLIR